MKKGISPIIIDNTNIISNYCVEYVKYGKMYGYKIEIFESNTPWAFDIEELTRRNKHEVDRSTLIEMLHKYESLDAFKRKLGLIK